MTLKLIWLTDLHLLPDGETLNDHDTVARFEIAVAYIREQHADARFCVLSGDLTERGDAASYQILSRIMRDAGLEYLPLAGNHDVREALLQQLQLPVKHCHNTCEPFVQYALNVGGYRLIALDTLSPGNSEGLLCAQRLEWLRNELENDTTTPTLVFCHHPPAELHLPMLDQMRLSNGDDLLDVLGANPNVRHLFFGHIHRPVSGTFRHLGFTAVRATSLQAPLPFPDWNWDTFAPVTEAPALGIILCKDNNVVIHSHNFCTATDALVT